MSDNSNGQASVLPFPARAATPTFEERQSALAAAMRQEIREVILRYCPTYYASSGEVRGASAERDAAGKLTW